MNTPTRDDNTTPIASSAAWPCHVDGRRIKPLGVLLSAAGRDKHCGREATVGHCIAVQVQVELERVRQVIEQIARVQGHPEMNAGSLAALEMAISLVWNEGEIGMSAAGSAWERNEAGR